MRVRTGPARRPRISRTILGIRRDARRSLPAWRAYRGDLVSADSRRGSATRARVACVARERSDATPLRALRFHRSTERRARFQRDLCRRWVSELAQRAELRPDLGREEFRLFPRCEMTALVDLVKRNELVIRAIAPPSRRFLQLPSHNLPVP